MISRLVQERLIFLVYLGIAFVFHLSVSISLSLDNEYIQTGFFWFSLVIEHSLKPIEVFFHEASHALVGMLFGREVYGLSLSWQGFGQVRLEEAATGPMAVTAFAGYVGAAVWGYLIYVSSLHGKRYTRALLFTFCLAFLYQCANLETLLILLTIMGVFLLSWLFEQAGGYLLRFIGIFIVVSAIYSPTYLVRYNAGDHVVMQALTGIDAHIWIGVWIMIAVICLLQAYRVLGLLMEHPEDTAATIKAGPQRNA